MTNQEQTQQLISELGKHPAMSKEIAEQILPYGWDWAEDVGFYQAFIVHSKGNESREEQCQDRPMRKDELDSTCLRCEDLLWDWANEMDEHLVGTRELDGNWYLFIHDRAIGGSGPTKNLARLSAWKAVLDARKEAK